MQTLPYLVEQQPHPQGFSPPPPPQNLVCHSVGVGAEERETLGMILEEQQFERIILAQI